MKKLLIILVLFFPKVLMAYECGFDQLVPGKTKKQLEELNIYAYGPEENGIFIYNINSFDICKEDLSKVHGLTINLFFKKNDLIKVNYENNIPNNSILFDIANNVYKLNFKRDQTKVLKKQPESYSLDKGQNSYFYLNIKANDNQREFLEIIDDTKIDELEKAILKSEEPKQ